MASSDEPQKLCSIYHGDCFKLIGGGIDAMEYEGLIPVVVTDPPFNIGYHYHGFKDKISDSAYYSMLAEITGMTPSVVIHYPEQMHRLSMEKKEYPERVCSWVYNSNTAKQHRDVAFYGIKPDMSRVKQPYKNPNDKRIKQRIAQGKGARLYDWWNVNQVKNVSKRTSSHPCQMPLEVMKNIIGVLPDGIGVIDPFSGSGTTAAACKELGVPFICYEIVRQYFDESIEMLKEASDG